VHGIQKMLRLGFDQGKGANLVKGLDLLLVWRGEREAAARPGKMARRGLRGHCTKPSGKAPSAPLHHCWQRSKNEKTHW